MFTRCPECQTAFRVTVTQLKVRDGLVRCGRCSAVFRADLRLFAAPEGTDADNVAAASTTSDTRTEPVMDEPQADTVPHRMTFDTDEPEIPVITDLSIFLPPRRRLIHPLLWLLGIVVALALLIGQFAYFYRNELAQLPELEPWLTKYCRVLHCSIMSAARRTTPELLETKIAPHPRFANALRIRASIVSRADTPRPLPLMEVTLTGSEGQLLARRTFAPRDYLPMPDATTMMSPNIVVQTLLDVTNPDNKATGYEIKLFPPESVGNN